MPVLHFSQSGFDTAIPGTPLAMVDFWASWCAPCRMLAPVIEKIAEKYEGKALVGKVDVDAEGELAVRYGVMSIPTVIFFKNGEEIDRKIGLMPAEAYEQVLNQQ